MLRTLPQTRDFGLAQRLTTVALFTLLTAVAARVVIPFEPVPFTLQPLAVMLAGLVLGWRDGALSQLAYIALLAVGLPLDSRGVGAAALVGPTAGYIYGFVVAAAVTGYLAQMGAQRFWVRWLAGVAGVAVMYAIGIPYMKAVTGLDWQAAWTAGGALFIVPDMAKAIIAAALSEGGRALLLRGMLPRV